jgi:hypothetical protein
VVVFAPSAAVTVVVIEPSAFTLVVVDPSALVVDPSASASDVGAFRDSYPLFGIDSTVLPLSDATAAFKSEPVAAVFSSSLLGSKSS